MAETQDPTPDPSHALVTTPAEAKDEWKRLRHRHTELTAKLREVARNLAFVGFGVVWAVRARSDEVLVIAEPLAFACLAFIAALAIDIALYLVLIWDTTKTGLRTRPDIKANLTRMRRRVPVMRYVSDSIASSMMLLTTGLVVLGYLFIAVYLIEVVRVT